MQPADGWSSGGSGFIFWCLIGVETIFDAPRRQAPEDVRVGWGFHQRFHYPPHALQVSAQC